MNSADMMNSKKTIDKGKAKEYFETEMKFSVLIADVNKIIGDAIKDVLK